jgi:bacterioferritin-associated ferredoxin
MLITTINFALYVCLCRGVTDRSINAEITRGACTVDEIAACTGAGTGCGRCRREIAEMILQAPAETTVTRRVSLAVVREGEDAGESTRAA